MTFVKLKLQLWWYTRYRKRHAFKLKLCRLDLKCKLEFKKRRIRKIGQLFFFFTLFLLDKWVLFHFTDAKWLRDQGKEWICRLIDNENNCNLQFRYFSVWTLFGCILMSWNKGGEKKGSEYSSIFQKDWQWCPRFLSSLAQWFNCCWIQLGLLLTSCSPSS